MFFLLCFAEIFKPFDLVFLDVKLGPSMAVFYTILVMRNPNTVMKEAFLEGTYQF